jgi:hypothetical protein
VSFLECKTICESTTDHTIHSESNLTFPFVSNLNNQFSSYLTSFIGSDFYQTHCECVCGTYSSRGHRNPTTLWLREGLLQRLVLLCRPVSEGKLRKHSWNLPPTYPTTYCTSHCSGILQGLAGGLEILRLRVIRFSKPHRPENNPTAPCPWW